MRFGYHSPSLEHGCQIIWLNICGAATECLTREGQQRRLRLNIIVRLAQTLGQKGCGVTVIMARVDMHGKLTDIARGQW